MLNAIASIWQSFSPSKMMGHASISYIEIFAARLSLVDIRFLLNARHRARLLRFRKHYFARSFFISPPYYFVSRWYIFVAALLWLHSLIATVNHHSFTIIRRYSPSRIVSSSEITYAQLLSLFTMLPLGLAGFNNKFQVNNWLFRPPLSGHAASLSPGIFRQYRLMLAMQDSSFICLPLLYNSSYTIFFIKVYYYAWLMLRFFIAISRHYTWLYYFRHSLRTVLVSHGVSFYNSLGHITDLIS